MNRIAQYLVYPIVLFFSKPFFDVEFRNPDGFKQIIGKPAVIIANHIAFYDSFLLRLNEYSTQLDVFFMGVLSFNHWYMKAFKYLGIVPFVYLFFGVFLVIPGKGLSKNLEPAKALLAKGKHVFIFPEGSMNTKGEIQSFRMGAPVLVAETKMPVLPISYKIVREAGKRKKIIISLGEVMNFGDGSTPEQIRDLMEARVRSMQAAS